MSLLNQVCWVLYKHKVFSKELLDDILALIEADRPDEQERWQEWFYLTRYLDADDLCPACGGRGKRMYGSTATWRGGFAGQAITVDVCDKCWGSGSKSKPWKSWKEVK